MQMTQLECFMAAAEHGSFTAAAEHLYISQPAVSKQIKALERELKVTLFFRKYRSVELTPSGVLLHDFFRSCRHSFAAVLQHARELEHSKHTQRLNIGLFEGASLGNLPALLGEFASLHPSVAVSVLQRDFYMLFSELLGGGLDVIFTLEYMMSGAEKEKVACLPLTQARHVAYISKKHPLAQKEELTLSDLRYERYYVPAMEDDTLTREYCGVICRAHGFHPVDIRTVPNLDSVFLALELGQGAAILDDKVESLKIRNFRAVPTDFYSPVVIAWLRAREEPLIFRFAREIAAAYGSAEQ